MIRIFVTVGSQKFQFNRLLSAIDELDVDKYQIFAQIGFSDYHPRNYHYIDFLERNEFLDKIKNADLIISHAGTGAIVSALLNGKKVLAVSRLKKYNEHVDNHQTEILGLFMKKNYINGLNEIVNLEAEIENTMNTSYSVFYSNAENFSKKLIQLIENLC